MSVADTEIDARYGQQPPPRYFGKYAGLVLDNGPPSQGGSHRGRIKVQVPGILEEKPSSDDQRPLEVLADPAFLPGFFFVPEKDDPVWVEFVAGDINYPIWTGVWYPEAGTPRTADGAMPTLDQKVIRTRSGQVITLEDTEGGEQLVIKDEKNGNTITLDAKGITLEATAAITLSFKPTSGKPSTITLDANGIALEATDVNVKVDNAMDVS